eukprot:Colp12_sorted_trinity150504_noHs@4115
MVQLFKFAWVLVLACAVLTHASSVTDNGADVTPVADEYPTEVEFSVAQELIEYLQQEDLVSELYEPPEPTPEVTLGDAPLTTLGSVVPTPKNTATMSTPVASTTGLNAFGLAIDSEIPVSQTSESGLSSGAIIGIVVGCAVAGLAVGLFVHHVAKRKQQRPYAGYYTWA